LFRQYHKYNTIADKDSLEAKELREGLFSLKAQIIESASNAPRTYPKARGIAKRFKENPEYYFTFLDHPEVKPTNNPAELGARSIVIDRKISYGTQSLGGILFCETMWTIEKTLQMRGQNSLDFIMKAMAAYEAGEPLPSLVNIGSTVDPKYYEMAKKEKLDEDLLQKLSSKQRGKKASKNNSNGTGKGQLKPEPNPASRASMKEKSNRALLSLIPGFLKLQEKKSGPTPVSPPSMEGRQTTGSHEPNSNTPKTPGEWPNRRLGTDNKARSGSAPSASEDERQTAKPQPSPKQPIEDNGSSNNTPKPWPRTIDSEKPLTFESKIPTSKNPSIGTILSEDLRQRLLSFVSDRKR
jgi:hypothetical protein